MRLSFFMVIVLSSPIAAYSEDVTSTTQKPGNAILIGASVINRPDAVVTMETAPGDAPVAQLPNVDLPRLAETYLFLRAEGELAFAALIEAQKSIPSELRTQFLSNTESLMKQSNNVPGSLFMSLIRDRFLSDLREFPKNLNAHLANHPVPSNEIIGNLLILLATLSDPSQGLAGFAGIRPHAALSKIEQAIVVGGVSAALALESRDTIDEFNKIIKKIRPEVDWSSSVDALYGKCQDLKNDVVKLKKSLSDANIKRATDINNSSKDIIVSGVDSIFSDLANIAKFLKASDDDLRRLQAGDYMIDSAINCYASINIGNFDGLLTSTISAVTNYFILVSGKTDDLANHPQIMKLIQWMQIGVGLYNAKTQEQFSAIADSITGPISLYRDLRQDGCVYLALKGYVGVTYGQEWSRGSDRTVTRGSYVGAIAPLGVEIGWSTPCPVVTYIGVLASPLDLGAITATRFDSKTEPSGTSFRDFLAPGGYLMIGLSKNWPFSLGLGYQYSPYQRRDAATGSPLPVNRAMAFLSVEIPLIGKRF